MAQNTFPDIRSYRPGNEVRWLTSGEDFFTHLNGLIAGAQELIHLQFYIFEPDDTGNETIERLIEAAKRGVKVFVVIDAFGSNKMTKKKEQEMKSAGINIRRFAPFMENKFIFIGRRLHHKILVVDDKTALVGGINIADKYRGTAKEVAWVDFAVMVKGNLCVDLSKICNRIWLKQFEAQIRFNKPKLPKFSKMEPGVTLIRVVENDWLRGKKAITVSHRRAFKAAKSSIVIVGSYFLPGIRYRQLMKKTAKRGVKIQILLTGFADVPMVKNATRYLYSWLLRNDITFYEIKDRMLHGKAMVVDDIWTTIGSYNINDLSIYNNVECNIDVLDEGFAMDFKKHVMDLIEKQSVLITKEDYEQKINLWGKFYDWISYQVMIFSARILLFFTHKINRREE